MPKSQTWVFATLVYLSMIPQASACYHFKIWHYAHRQRCQYEEQHWTRPSRVETKPKSTFEPLFKPFPERLKFPTIDRLGLYYRDWHIWRAEEIEVPDLRR